MHRTYAPKGLVCMTISMDRPTDKPAALAFLKEKDAKFPNLILLGAAADADKELFQRFGFEGGLPHVALFARDGRKVWDSSVDDRPKTDKELEQLVEAELAK